jgi:hypothetical protein
MSPGWLTSTGQRYAIVVTLAAGDDDDDDNVRFLGFLLGGDLNRDETWGKREVQVWTGFPG